MNRDQALTATLDELRDARAEMDGWKKPGTPWIGGTNYMHDDVCEQIVRSAWWRLMRGGDIDRKIYHPYPPTLDGADSAMPEGYEWERTPFEWWAWKHGSRMDGPAAKIDDTGNKTADLYRLAVLCCLAEKEASK